VIDVRLLRQDSAAFRAALLRRGDFNLGSWVDSMIQLDRDWRALVTQLEQLKAVQRAE
jgi:seryl-tRNA synthetase